MHVFTNGNLQEPVRITLKQTHVIKVSGRKRRMVVKRDELIYIPLLLTLERLLNNGCILDQVCLCLIVVHVLLFLRRRVYICICI